jgi:hypothetical protein
MINPANSSLDARNLVFFIFFKLLMRAIHLLVYYLLFELLIALSASCTGTCFIRKIYAPSSSLLQGKHQKNEKYQVSSI